MPVSEIADSPSRIEERTKKEDDGAGGLIERKVKFPIWFEPKANGGTPMCQVLEVARKLVENWLGQHPTCFPPIVINITDGESTDGDPSSAADSIKSLSTTDGNVLLYTCHLSSENKPKIEFPDSEAVLPDEHSRLMFRISSPLHDSARADARERGYDVTDGTRGFVFQADNTALIGFLNIGTRPSNLR